MPVPNVKTAPKRRYSFYTAEDAREYEDRFPGCRTGDKEVILTSDEFHSVKLYQSNDAPFQREYMDRNWFATDPSARLRGTFRS